MKRLLTIIAVYLGACAWSTAQETVADSIANDPASITNEEFIDVEDSNPLSLTAKDSLFLDYLETFVSQQRDPEYKLYPTKNSWTFLRLNTRTGQIDIVQWSHERKNRFIYDLDNNKRIYSWHEDICGRFILQETTNYYNFILLDQIDGRCWQVQWSTNENECFVTPIY